MHIVHVGAFPFPSPQGSQVYVRGILKGLSALGHQVTLLCYGHGAGELDDGYEIIRTPKIPGYHNMRAGPDVVKPLLDLFLAVKLAQLKPDVVHVHNYEAPLAELIARCRRKVPMVYSAHNLMEEELHTYFTQPQVRRFAKKIGGFLDRNIPRRADHSIAIREESMYTLQQLGCRKVSHVSPGVDPQEFMNIQSKELPSGSWVIYAGNPDPYQNLNVLMKAMQRLPDVGLIMISASNMDHWKNWGVQKLLCVQTTDFREVCQYLAAANIAVLPREVCSGFPIKLLNYLAMGIPTVCAEGSKINLPGIVGFSNGDDVEMAQRIQELVDNERYCKDLGQQAKTYVLSNCTWEVQAKKLERIYIDCIQKF